MKKIFYLALLATVLPFALSSCSDNGDDIPDVAFNMEVGGGAVMNNNTIYVAQGDTLAIESLGVTNLESDKAAAVTYANYYWDYNLLGVTRILPYSFDILISKDAPVGEHVLTVEAGVVAVDKAPAVAVVNYQVQVVADSTQLPSQPDSNIATMITTPR